MNHQCSNCMPQGCHHGCGGGQMQHRCQSRCCSHSHSGCQSRCSSHSHSGCQSRCSSNSHGGYQSRCSSNSHGGCQSRCSSNSHGGCQSNVSSHSSYSQSPQSSRGSQSQLMPLGNQTFGGLLERDSQTIREQFHVSYNKREYVLGSDGRMKAVNYSHSQTLKIRGFGEDSDDDN